MIPVFRPRCASLITQGAVRAQVGKVIATAEVLSNQMPHSHHGESDRVFAIRFSITSSADLAPRTIAAKKDGSGLRADNLDVLPSRAQTGVPLHLVDPAMLGRQGAIVLERRDLAPVALERSARRRR